MTRKILVLLTVILVVSCIAIPVFATTYTIPINSEAVTLQVYENDQLRFRYNNESLTWKTFSDNHGLNLYIINSIGLAQYRIFTNNVYSSVFSTTYSSDYQLGTYGIKINWDFIESNLSAIVPDDLDTEFIVVPKTGRNTHFYIIDESNTEDEDSGTTLPEGSDDDKKKWYDYLLDGIKKYFDAVVDYVVDLFYFPDAVDALKNLLSSFNLFIDRFSTVTIQPFVDFVNNLNNGVLNYIGRIWEFPIIKDLTYGLVIIALVGGLFRLFITL